MAMKSLVQCALLGLGGVLLWERACGQLTPIDTTPAIFWSNDDFLGTKESYVFEAVSRTQLQTYIGKLSHAGHEMSLQKTGLDQYLTAQTPELVLMLNCERMSTDDLSRLGGGYLSMESLSPLKEIVTRASESLFIPHVLPEDVAVKISGDQITIPHENLKTYLASPSGSRLLRDGIPQILNVELGSILETLDGESYLKDIVDLLSDKPVVFGLTSRNASPLSLSLKSTVVASMARRRAEEKTGSVLCPPGYYISTPSRGKKQFCFKRYIWITPDILFGLVLSVFLVGVALCGVRCIGQIQTPTRFVSQALPPGKEY